MECKGCTCYCAGMREVTPQITHPKNPYQVAPLLTLFACLLGTPALFMLAGFTLFTLLRSDQVAIVVTLSGIVGLIVGGLLGVILFFTIKTTRRLGVWTATRRQERAERQRWESGAHLEAPTDPWQGQNPYGCCRDHRGPDGGPSHGGPGCLHPEARGGRESDDFQPGW